MLHYRPATSFGHKLPAAAGESEGMKWIWAGKQGASGCVKGTEASRQVNAEHLKLAETQAHNLTTNQNQVLERVQEEEREGEEGK